jgi:hypothetical protein
MCIPRQFGTNGSDVRFRSTWEKFAQLCCVAQANCALHIDSSNDCVIRATVGGTFGLFPRESAAKIGTLPKKRAGAFAPALSQILGEDRHVGLIVVHCNKDNCKCFLNPDSTFLQLRQGAAALAQPCRPGHRRSPPVLPLSQRRLRLYRLSA